MKCTTLGDKKRDVLARRLLGWRLWSDAKIKRRTSGLGERSNMEKNEFMVPGRRLDRGDRPKAKCYRGVPS